MREVQLSAVACAMPLAALTSQPDFLAARQSDFQIEQWQKPWLTLIRHGPMVINER